MEQSVYIIKPEGMSYRPEIRKMIEIAGLAIVSSLTTTLPERVLAELYPDLYEERNELWQATLDHLFGKQCEVGIIEGEDAVTKLFKLCGEATSPLSCIPCTIRALFGTEIPPVPAGTRSYWRNVIHRSKNKEEAENDLRIARKLMTPECR